MAILESLRREKNFFTFYLKTKYKINQEPLEASRGVAASLYNKIFKLELILQLA